MLLVYDGDCGFCTRCARWAERRFRRPVRVVAWQRFDLASVGLTEDEAAAAVQWVDANGTAAGHAAVARALMAMGPAARLGGRLLLVWPLAAMARALYAVVARNRYRLPGSSDACRL